MKRVAIAECDRCGEIAEIQVGTTIQGWVKGHRCPADRRRAFRVVDDFEAALCEYTGAPHTVTTDSCTNAIFLACRYWNLTEGYAEVRVPKHTYVGVYHAVLRSGLGVKWSDEQWAGSYRITPTNVVDSAKRFERGMYQPDTLTCVSFQAGKLLPIGRGGAVLTNNQDTAEWLRRARLDGRTQGVDYADATFQKSGWHMYLTPDYAARGLWLMTYLDDNDQCDWTEYPNLAEATWL